MGKVIADISMSVDGYSAGPKIGTEHPLGEGGQRLHRWIGQDGTETSEADREVAGRIFATSGAVVLGRRMFDVGEEPWGDDGAFGKPCFVVTHRPRERLVKGPTTFTFVTEGVHRAVELACTAAGDRDVWVPGGADVVRQLLLAGLVDDLRLHVVPVLFGRGTLLFDGGFPDSIELEQVEATTTPLATHLTFRIR
jgi:dihydrofolate reductase